MSREKHEELTRGIELAEIEHQHETLDRAAARFLLQAPPLHELPDPLSRTSMLDFMIWNFGELENARAAADPNYVRTGREPGARLLHEPCSVGARCVARPDADWFEIIRGDGVTFNFCPRHSLAAEGLSAFGMAGETVAAELKRLERQRG